MRTWPSANPPAGGFLPYIGARGFTLIELIVTMVIVGIMATVLLPKWGGNSGFDERAFRDQVVAGLRYAQKSAIASRRTVCASFAATPASVSFSRAAYGATSCAGGVALEGPSGTAFSITANSGVSFASLPATVVFDASGRPAGAATISISGLTDVISVEAETGYVH